ncbi:bifunctional methylenetetrahydrofolate dehydrogenase/methenyltetrahydrofolate cyclohydrolase FolD [Brevibacillus laterosporus]|uniref:bifunctional methylenetetrahydrofolate dehydrogenase/methenyltetrahydrofolate cyclohydrolase FolD n=1 Tax=Brevibacillus laterosporus TaxID=1465 RepID=UPI00035C25B2|nr:bifunctional methylenetetrahydrofolate dehydrogenase/methenyltetrahydrofolate cyclohydrolase FolD [Brevibacillus laterosporus]ATO50957.1 bifunctional methylenetetrahydrofolate dehydrogenase/methenyltetrahydrofolate cyclohydrolase [Brevibacillus laterosporus DSM 25]MBG9802431.1 5,10-methylene-tetrahydrofolate cyclohydrolase [Brevibacillus laterosporus]MED2004785.1 bifunctional methylenetetrahydrofolate dehydrogenase/methenyltetrahydrofolate cyclohydrolase FolD [Brevibacillus laterosporus]MED4
MTAQVINGKEFAKSYRARIKQEVAELVDKGIQPGLAVVLVGDDPASQTYVNGKIKACEETGITSKSFRLESTVTQQEVVDLVEELNQDPNIHGILVQLPLPKHMNEEAIIDTISPEKDVDGFHPISVGNLCIGKDTFLPCTPHGVIELIKSTGISMEGKHAVVVGRSNIVGKPVSLLLLHENATVTMCHSRTKNLEEQTRQADILVVAVGIAHLIKKEHVKEGAIVIDVGMNRLDGKLTGDVLFDEVKEVASHITPVPGGVGPMTITMLMQNTVISAKRKLTV